MFHILTSQSIRKTKNIIINKSNRIRISNRILNQYLPSRSYSVRNQYNDIHNIHNKNIKEQRKWLKQVVDVNHPHLWYPQARKLQRKIICHIGPTNSGKTYNALKSLKEASTGVYCGPLRLLAWEIMEKLRTENVKCDLKTGQECDTLNDSTHVACTVEMTELNERYDVAVIDEMQMIGDPERGWAWTQAFLGLQCKEIHICGSPSYLPLIQELCRHTQDTVIKIEYQRLSPLHLSNTALYSYNQHLLQGDCIVGFSRTGCYKTKMAIESSRAGNNLKCSVI